MIERKVKTVRALERGLDVLLEVQSRRGAGLHELHQATGLPKATLLRMLTTLGRKGLIWQRLADGAYLPHVDSVAFTKVKCTQQIAEIASRHMKELSKKVAWPSVLAVPRLDHMEILETNSPLFRLEAATLGPVGVKLSYIHTSTGRAYLAACSEAERDAIIARLRPADASDASEAELRAIISETRARGYATREPLFAWPDRSRQLVLRDGRRSFGVAIQSKGEAVGAINITWIAKRMVDEQVISSQLEALRAAARAIGADLDRQDA